MNDVQQHYWECEHCSFHNTVGIRFRKLSLFIKMTLTPLGVTNQASKIVNQVLS